MVTGPSGSGKSSLAFDTVYAEGQRRYVESLSSYARQFLGMSDKPDVDDISGLSPAISIEQKGSNHNPRSTVGTVTEIYDYLRLLYGRAGTPHCPKCGREVHRYSVDEIIDLIYKEYDGKPLEIYSPVVKAKKGEYKNLLLKLHQQGYMRARIDGTLYWLEEAVELDKKRRHTIECLIDRMRVKEENRSRLSEAIEMALKLSDGFIMLASEGTADMELTEKYICPECQISLPDIEPRLFSFNAPFGACPDCGGLGFHSHFSPELAVNPELPLGEGGFIPWKSMKYMVHKAEKLAEKKGWDIGKPFKELPETVQQELLYGSDEVLELTFTDKKNGDWEYNGKYIGLIPWIEKRYNELKELAANVKKRPMVFSGEIRGGNWYAVGGKSFLAELFRDAGADYFLKDDPRSGGVTLDFETVYSQAESADYWRIVNSYDGTFTYDALKSLDPRYADFRAFREKGVVYCNMREKPFYESMPMQPEIVLEDLIHAFHPDLLPDYKPTYYELLK